MIIILFLEGMYSAEIKNNWPVLQISNAKTCKLTEKKILQELRNKQYRIK